LIKGYNVNLQLGILMILDRHYLERQSGSEIGGLKI